MCVNSSLCKKVKIWSSFTPAPGSVTGLQGEDFFGDVRCPFLSTQKTVELFWDHQTGPPGVQRNRKTSSNEGLDWDYDRAERHFRRWPGRRFRRQPGQSQCLQAASSTPCTKVGKRESPLLYTFQCANGDEGVSRSDLSCFEDLARTNTEWGVLESAATYWLLPQG